MECNKNNCLSKSIVTVTIPINEYNRLNMDYEKIQREIKNISLKSCVVILDEDGYYHLKPEGLFIEKMEEIHSKAMSEEKFNISMTRLLQSISSKWWFKIFSSNKMMIEVSKWT